MYCEIQSNSQLGVAYTIPGGGELGGVTDSTIVALEGSSPSVSALGSFIGVVGILESIYRNKKLTASQLPSNGYSEFFHGGISLREITSFYHMPCL